MGVRQRVGLERFLRRVGTVWGGGSLSPGGGRNLARPLPVRGRGSGVGTDQSGERERKPCEGCAD